ncbi:hypothetical protein [Spirillospora sp. NPDC029432]|uniref:hypothetical protein n=1 Tax=Spirillospora sp. NPDC029432 TaxID=3154599 RepID=UPI003452727F
MRKYAEWRRERGSWVLCEEIRAQACELRALLDAVPDGAGGADLLDGAREELDRARGVIDFDTHRRAASASHVTTAQVHLDTARSLWLRTLAPAEVEAHLPGMLAVVKEHLAAGDERRTAVEGLARDMRAAREAGQPFDLRPSQRAAIVGAVNAARQAELRERLRAGSFVVIVRWVAAFLFALALAVAVLSAVFKTTVPLCFQQAAPEAGGQPRFGVVCPTGESAEPVAERDLGRETASVVSHRDYIVVEFAGLVAAGVAAASALRRIRGTSTVFGIPVALAMLKLPTGALTAVLGLLLMRGGFVPGLSALDSSAQIIGWAIIFGYSQELFTKFVDRRGQDVLDGIRGPGGPAPGPETGKP